MTSNVAGVYKIAPVINEIPLLVLAPPTRQHVVGGVTKDLS
jgi:hypothetical protein